MSQWSPQSVWQLGPPLQLDVQSSAHVVRQSLSKEPHAAMQPRWFPQSRSQ